jgi:hypothetical protein
MNRQTGWSSIILWIIYLALLAALLPHTAWAFARFEPPSSGWLGISWGQVTAWAAAFAFEAAIAALTHRLAQRIEATPNYTGDRVLLHRLSYQYLNAYAGGLLVVLSVSALANFAHAVEYGQEFAIFRSYEVPPLLYSVTFGGILPLVSLLFARILGDAADAQSQPDPELTKAKQIIGELDAGLEMAKERSANAEARAVAAEQRFTAAGDLFARLFAEEKRQRILAAAEKWPELTGASIAVIANASPGYVSEVLKGSEDQ